MKRAFITGIAGFAGSHLAERLLSEGWEVAGTDRPAASLENLANASGRVRVEDCDVLRNRDLERFICEWRPDAVFHLAGVAFVPSAESDPRKAFAINVEGTLNVLEACGRKAPRARVIVAGSAEVYGKVAPEENPLKEDRPPSPANLYALTKLCAEDLASFYHRSAGLPVVVLRPFNHIGPRQRPVFVTSSFARQIAEIEAGMKEPVLEVGNLEAARDFTDVRDTVRAYVLAAGRCTPGTPYNVCSGRAYVIREILERLLRLSDRRIEVRQDPKRLRKSDVPVFCGDHSRLSSDTGWRPRYGIDETLASILDYWRGQVKTDVQRPG